MVQEVNFSITVVKTSLIKEEFIKSFSNIEWVKNLEANSWRMKNNYGYFSIDNSEEFRVFGLINTDNFSNLLDDLNKINYGYWVDLYDDGHNLIDCASKDYWEEDN